MNKLASSVLLCSLTACASQPAPTLVQKPQETLTIYEDGKMVFNDRLVNLDDVVIYPDGIGGERAAIKMRMPSKPDFYRDSITVQRITSHIDGSPAYSDKN